MILPFFPARPSLAYKPSTLPIPVQYGLGETVTMRAFFYCF